MLDFPKTDNPEIAKLYIAHTVALRAVRLLKDRSVDVYLMTFNKVFFGIAKEPEGEEE